MYKLLNGLRRWKKSNRFKSCRQTLNVVFGTTKEKLRASSNRGFQNSLNPHLSLTIKYISIQKIIHKNSINSLLFAT
jgi:hypothetical protein